MAAADLTAVTRLDSRVFGPSAWTRAELDQELHGPDRLYLVWQGRRPAQAQAPGAPTPRESSVILGYAGIWIGGPQAHLLTIAVDPATRRSRIGTALISAAAEAARLARCRSMRLEVRVDNTAALSFYRHLGFARCGYEPHYYQPEDVDALVLEVALQPRDEH